MTPDRPQLLQSNSVHIWDIGYNPAGAGVAEFGVVLSAEEMARARRFVSPEVGARWGYYRLALRRILGCYTDMAPQRLQFRNSDRGKPELVKNDARLEFNLSHSASRAAVAVTRLAPIGIDIECIRRFDHMAEVVARFFSAAELRYWTALPAARQIDAFYECWTRKEALIKALGLGLHAPLTAFDVPHSATNGWQLATTRPPLSQQCVYPILGAHPADGFVAAVALCIDAAQFSAGVDVSRFHYDNHAARAAGSESAAETGARD